MQRKVSYPRKYNRKMKPRIERGEDETLTKKFTLAGLKEYLAGHELMLRVPGTIEFSVDIRRLIVDLFGAQVSSRQMGKVLERMFTKCFGLVMKHKEIPSSSTVDNMRHEQNLWCDAIAGQTIVDCKVDKTTGERKSSKDDQKIGQMRDGSSHMRRHFTVMSLRVEGKIHKMPVVVLVATDDLKIC